MGEQPLSFYPAQPALTLQLLQHPVTAFPSRPDLEHARRTLYAWFQRHGRKLPWRDNPTPYAVLVSEFMLQQTQVVTVIPYFERWMQQFPNIETLAAAQEADVLSIWQGLGYYSRARNLHAAARAIVTRHGGHIPEDLELLRALPGVGAYSAGAIAAFAFDQRVPTVDANIARVLTRIGNIQEPIDSAAGKKAVWDLAAFFLPERGGGRLHTSALMELGALLCSPRQPQCLLCPLKADCRATAPETLPRKAPRRKTETGMEYAAWIESPRGILLEQQTGKRATGLWKLPGLSAAPETKHEPLFTTVYGFTHHRITLEVFPAVPPPHLSETLRWFPKDTVLQDAPLVAAHRRALQAVLETHL